MIVALLSPANAQFWGDSWGWGGRQQQRQQPYNPFGGSWGDRPGGFWGDRQTESPRYPRQKERVRETEREEPPDYSRAPPSSPRKDATVKIVVMGDANADWLAYGLEDAFSENTDIGIVRRHRTESGLIRYDQRRDTEWPQAAREIIAAEKPRYIVMMVGNNDRQPIREKISPAAPADCSAAEYAAWQGWERSSRIAITVGPGAASVRGAASRTQHHGGAVAPNFFWPLGVPFGSMGTRLRKTDRCNHRRAKERRSAGDLGWSPFPARSKG